MTELVRGTDANASRYQLDMQKLRVLGAGVRSRASFTKYPVHGMRKLPIVKGPYRLHQSRYR
jgi:hypothetical protein